MQIVPIQNILCKEVTYVDRIKERVHPPYFFLQAYQRRAGYSNEEMGKLLGMSGRSYLGKVLGWSDFTNQQAVRIATFFDAPQDSIFLT